MDNTQLLAGREFAAYDYLFENLLQEPDIEEADKIAKTDTGSEGLSPRVIRRDMLLALQALFNQAVAQSDIQDLDVQRLCASHEAVINEMKNLLNQLAIGV